MTTDSRTNQWLKSSLATLGSAAVLTVYAAGFARTKPAADRFADESNQRRPSPPPPPVITVGHVDVAPTPRPVAKTKPAPKKAEKKRSDTISAAVKPAEPTSVVAEPVVAAAVPAPPVSPPANAPPDTAKPADKAPVVLKDGVYSGWGTSRHGDIQAYVEIKGGKIASTFISECLTQYSCSWIAKLPGQVVARQSPEVDYVSGATQSTNAFYYAVVEALKKAK